MVFGSVRAPPGVSCHPPQRLDPPKPTQPADSNSRKSGTQTPSPPLVAGIPTTVLRASRRARAAGMPSALRSPPLRSASLSSQRRHLALGSWFQAADRLGRPGSTSIADSRPRWASKRSSGNSPGTFDDQGSSRRSSRWRRRCRGRPIPIDETLPGRGACRELPRRGRTIARWPGRPRFVEDEFRGLLGCGCFADGFARFQCGGCHADRQLPGAAVPGASCGEGRPGPSAVAGAEAINWSTRYPLLQGISVPRR